ncbi:MAG: type I restriction-modification system subunit M N-terminal domain-containing protein [Deltaproteobacteria bacterium]|nr:type I restriction-modification system subunit M N-terminal domain-containing protein [Deltaproteobacteria bacterium]
MEQAAHNKIVSFIWGIADDVLRDLFVRGKYRDVILPMCVLRRLDAVLEPTKQAVLETKAMLDSAGITEQYGALAAAAGQAFYHTSKFSLRDLKSRGSHQQLKADFEDYLDGFSHNVQEILLNFEFRNVLARLSKSDGLGARLRGELHAALLQAGAAALAGGDRCGHRRGREGDRGAAGGADQAGGGVIEAGRIRNMRTRDCEQSVLCHGTGEHSERRRSFAKWTSVPQRVRSCCSRSRIALPGRTRCSSPTSSDMRCATLNRPVSGPNARSP